MAKPAPHYSPLQQNYDRAVSPTPEDDSTYLDAIGMPAPNLRSGNSSAVGLGITPSMCAKQTSSVYGDGDSVLAEDALVSSRITVKGLTNLASYPNPVQKAAQNKLARARAVNYTLQRTDTPLSVYGGSGLRKDHVVSGTAVPIGTPKPLTAGAPGQRQFRPSTFESTVRALHGLDQEEPSMASVSDVDEDYQLNFDLEAPYTISLAQFFSNENVTPMKAQSRNEVYPYAAEERVARPYHAFNEMFSDDGFYNDTQRDIAECPLSPGSLKQARRRIPYDTEPLRNVVKYYPTKEYPRDLGKRSKEWAGHDFDAYKQRPHESPTQKRERHRTSVKANFYAGTEGLTKSLDQIIREHDSTSLKNTIGVIGEGRDRIQAPRSDRAGFDGKVRPPQLSIEQANMTHDSLHSEPLVTMGLATLLRRKEEMKRGNDGLKPFTSGFIPCDPAWIDHSIEGQKSFFDTSKDEFLRKKKAIRRRVGRGY